MKNIQQHRNRLTNILLGLCDGAADVILIQGPDKSDPADNYWILRIDVDDEAAEIRFRPEDIELRRLSTTTNED